MRDGLCMITKHKRGNLDYKKHRFDNENKM